LVETFKITISPQNETLEVQCQNIIFVLILKSLLVCVLNEKSILNIGLDCKHIYLITNSKVVRVHSKIIYFYRMN